MKRLTFRNVQRFSTVVELVLNRPRDYISSVALIAPIITMRTPTILNYYPSRSFYFDLLTPYSGTIILPLGLIESCFL